MTQTEFYQQKHQQHIEPYWKKLLTWININIINGYHVFTKMEDLQSIIDNITHWYEFKYPNKTMEINQGIIHPQLKEFEDISNSLTLKQLMFRFSHEGKLLMECKHRGNGMGIMRMKNENGKLENNVQVISIKIPKEDSITYVLHVRRDNGIVDNFDVEYYFKFIETKNITIRDLYAILKDKKELKLDLSELKSVINDYEIDLELRKNILQLTALNILYSKNTTLRYGYARAQKFIEEFNEQIPNLNLSTEEIDRIKNSEFNCTTPKIKVMVKQ